MKKCKYCHVEKDLIEFPIKRDGSYSGNCLSCKDKRKEYNRVNKENLSQDHKIYYQNNKQKILENRKVYYQNNKEEILDKNKNNYEENKESYLQYKKEYYIKNKDHFLRWSKDDRTSNPIKYLLKNTKKRAVEKNLPIDITEEDIIIPNVCPVLGIPIIIGNSLKNRDNSPSIDRVIPNLGYVKNNVRVISFRANSLKKDGSIEEFEKIIQYIKNNL